jgi:chromosome segregation ATPase
MDGKAKDALEAELARTKAHARALEEEAANLTAQIEAFAVVNARLQDAATSAQSRLDAQTAATENLKAQVATLEATIRASRDAPRASEGELKTKLRGALEELSKCIATRDETRVALQETMAKCASAMARTERAEESERATRKANDALTRSKKMLQETMVEQLAAVRAQLDRARAQSDQLERAVGRKKVQEDRLRAETTSGERGEDAGGDGEET